GALAPHPPRAQRHGHRSRAPDLRGHGDGGSRGDGRDAPLRPRPQEPGLPLRPGRLRRGIVVAPPAEAPARGLPEDRRELHPRPPAQHGRPPPGRGHRGHGPRPRQEDGRGVRRRGRHPPGAPRVRGGLRARLPHRPAPGGDRDSVSEPLGLSALVELVGRVRATSKKTEKVALIADFLRRTEGRETEVAALYLSGTLPQGRIGIGYRTIQAAVHEGPASGTPPSLLDVDRAFGAIAADEGAGSAERKTRALRELMGRAAAAGPPGPGGALRGGPARGAPA